MIAEKADGTVHPMTDEPTLEHVFTRRSEQWSEDQPLASALATLAVQTEAIRAIVAPAEVAQYAKPALLLSAFTRVLRESATDHELAQYFPTLGGTVAPDERFAAAVNDFVDRHREQLRHACARSDGHRQCAPFTVAIFWPAIAWFSAGRRVHLIELGGTAGVGLAVDKFAYRYAGRSVREARGPQLAVEAEGELPKQIESDIDVAGRYGLELAPIRSADADGIAWLLDCVAPDRPQERALLAAAVETVATLTIDWREGDYCHTLPQVLAEIPDEDLAIVYNAHTLCCNDNRAAVPRAFAESGRDLVWIAKEHVDVSLGLITGTQAHVEDTTSVVLTAVEYDGGESARAWKLADCDGLSRSLSWEPTQLPVV